MTVPLEKSSCEDPDKAGHGSAGADTDALAAQEAGGSAEDPVLADPAGADSSSGPLVNPDEAGHIEETAAESSPATRTLVPDRLTRTGSPAGRRMEQAGARIEAALARLEHGVQGLASQLGQREDESRQLFDALRRLKTEHEELLVAANAVANRLDGAVARVDHVLEEDRREARSRDGAIRDNPVPDNTIPDNTIPDRDDREDRTATER